MGTMTYPKTVNQLKNDNVVEHKASKKPKMFYCTKCKRVWERWRETNHGKNTERWHYLFEGFPFAQKDKKLCKECEK